MLSDSVKIGVVGCGQIADAHLQELRRTPGAEVVAVCDRYPDVAEQAAVRFGVPHVCSDLQQLLSAYRPDIVHVTTPPHTHHAVARQCLEAGVHVYVEKPFTSTVKEAEDLIRVAESRRLSVCLGHDQLLDPVWVECRQLIADGQLGDVVLVDATQGYDLDGPFGRLLFSDSAHWVHRLPGGMFQNVMSHAVARIADLLPDQTPRIHARWFTLRHDTTMPTELRASIYGSRVSANLIFTSAARPGQRITRVLGTKRAIEVDMDARVIRSFEASRWPMAFAKVDFTLKDFRESYRNLRTNLRRLRRSDLHYFAGMNASFRAFLESVRTGAPPPVSHADALRVTRIMDDIFCACRQSSGNPASVAPVAVGVA